MASTTAPTVAGLIRKRHLHWLVGSHRWRCRDTTRLRRARICFGEILSLKPPARHTSFSPVKDDAKFTKLRARSWEPSHSSLVQFSLALPLLARYCCCSFLLPPRPESVTHAQPYEVRKKPLPAHSKTQRTPRLLLHSIQLLCRSRFPLEYCYGRMVVRARRRVAVSPKTNGCCLGTGGGNTFVET